MAEPFDPDKFMAGRQPAFDPDAFMAQRPVEKPLGEQSPTFGGVARLMGSQAGRALTTAASDLNPLPLVNAVLHPIDTARGMFNATSDAVGRTQKAFGQGQYGEAAKSSLGAIPVIGPAVETVARDATEGRIPEAVGHAAAMYLGNKAPGVIGKGLRSAAEPLAESALGIKPINRAYGRTPGAAALDETSGFSPAKVAESAQQRLAQLTPELEATVGASTAPASLAPARSVLARAGQTAAGRNAPTIARQLAPMQEQLSTHAATGLPLAEIQAPRGLLELKRGFGDEFIHNWNPETMKGVRGTAAQTYHELGSELERAVPEAAGLNQRISSLIPVAERAESLERAPGVGQRSMQRVAAHTGALAAGTGLGYYLGGLPGAVAGAVIPEVVASPTSQMVAARTLNTTGKALRSPAAARVGRVLPLVQDQTR